MSVKAPILYLTVPAVAVAILIGFSDGAVIDVCVEQSIAVNLLDLPLI